jgi:EAL domain-containing protein (putative c-di-GMP-specific phosphodiesterase class I)
MYTAKGATKGVWLYESSLDTTTSPQRLALVGELRQAITLDQLTIHVQPKAFLNTAEVYSVEALVRWQHPQHGLLPPDEFVPMAERSGLIRPLTMAVLRQALAACAAWRKQGRELSVAVNLSARSLLDLDLADDVAALVRRYNLPGQLLTLELTEGSVMTDPTRTIGLLLQLADMGIRLSVDDFGTGYSSLSYLKRLPVHEVKVDKSFVTNMCHDSDDATIVRSIVDLAGNLSLDVVAEGVEDQTTWDRLQSMGCTAAQGYYLSRPMPLEEFAPWLEHYEQKRAVHTAEVGGTVAFFKRPKA